jgi:hypothetical protein
MAGNVTGIGTDSLDSVFVIDFVSHIIRARFLRITSNALLQLRQLLRYDRSTIWPATIAN